MTQIITTSSSVSGINVLVAADEFVFVAEAVTRASVDDAALYSSSGGALINLLGSLVSATDIGMELWDVADDTGDYHVTIGATGSVIGGKYGVFVRDADNTLVNQGAITGTLLGIWNDKGANFQLTNTGTITSHVYDAVASSGSKGNIVNYGLIQTLGTGSNSNGVEFYDNDPGATVTLTNYGIISAASGIAVVGDLSGVDRIFNFGVINGDVQQQGGSDFFRNGGQVLGDVDLGGGNDVFKGGGGTVEGRIHGRHGNDIILGGVSDNLIFGDAGDDVLKGGAGDDTLTGSLGRDVMTGGLGSDIFDFDNVNESAVGGQRDRIADFSKGDDLIDVSTIDADAGVGGNQAFTFIGSGAFTGSAGQLRAAGASSTFVSGDTDGDGNADFSILVVGVAGLTEGDFVL